jgi:hypothetical protein
MILPSLPIAAEKEGVMRSNCKAENLRLECVWIVTEHRLNCKWVEQSAGSVPARRSVEEAAGAEQKAA